MTLSRTARILIALLLATAAVFVWVNFFTEDRGGDGPVFVEEPTEGPSQEPTDDGTSVAVEGSADEGQDDGASPSASGPEALPSLEGPSGDGEAAAPTVVAPNEEEVVARDVEVADLPFLVTEPPGRADGTDEGSEDGGVEARPQGSRASVNPFSPILVQAPPEPEPEPQVEAEAEPEPEPEVQEVAVPEAPPVEEAQQTASAPPAPEAPAPRALAPSSPRNSGLPRALPGGTLPVAPEPLRTARAERVRRAPQELATMATLREPAGAPSASPQPVRPDDDEAPETDDGAPLAPGDVAAAAEPDEPLVAGSNPLSRYLRDRNVSFTGSVIGSVGVGVFRMAQPAGPVVVSLGQELPDSDIVLTELRGGEAQFTLGDTSQTLTLDLRR